MSAPAAIYRSRNPQSSDYYRCVEDYFETFVQIYDEHFSRQYGFWRPYVERVIYRYLDCGNLHNGFARVKCKDCVHEYLLALTLTSYCTSCHQKRVVEFGEWLCMDVLKKVPHRHFVFSIPKILRRYFLGACPRGGGDPGRRQKFTPRLSVSTAQAGRLPHTSWMTSVVNSPSMTITSIETLNIPGMTTSNHDAACIVRAGEVCLNCAGK